MKKTILSNLFILFALISFAQVDLTDGLVAHYPFNGNANDESGNEHHGTLHGPQLENDRYGIPNSAYNFNGTSDYIQLPNIIPPFKGSISYWYKTHSISQSQILVYHSNINSDGFGIGPGSTNIENHTAITGSGYNYVVFDNGQGTSATDSLVPIVVDTWYHVVVTYDAPNYASMYINGELVFTSDLSDETATNLPDRTYIGRPGSSTRYFNGVFDELRIYDRVLSEEEIGYLYNVNLNEGLVAHYPFNGNANDESGNGYNAETINATLTTDRFGLENKAYYFDGVTNVINMGNVLNDLFITNTYSLNIWFKPDNLINQNNKKGMLLSKWNSSNLGNNSFIVYAKNLNFATDGGSNSDNNIEDPPIGQWSMVTVVLDNGTAYVYLNGELKGVSTGHNNLASTYNLLVGNLHNSIYGFNGTIDDISIFQRTLNEAEIQALYDETLRADFVADKLDGFAPLTVSFDDLSVSDTEITSWQWDFDNDGTIDSEEQNPEFTFESGGSYCVKLTVSDGTHTNSYLINDYIKVFDLNHGLTRYYKLDGNVDDNTENEMHGEAYGAEVTDRYGIPQSAYAFSGENNVTVPSIANWGDQLTISFWFYAEETFGNHVLFGSREGSSGATKINMRSFLQEDGTVTFQVASDNSSNTDVTSSNTAEMFAWNHVICELDLVNGTETIILNGVETSKAYEYAPRYLDQNIGFGNWKEPFASTSGLIGKIDDVRFYNRALYQQEKDVLIVNDFPMVEYFGAEAIYPFNGGAADASGNGNDGDVNDALLTFDRYRNNKNAYAFTSSESHIDIGNGVKPESFPIYITAWINPSTSEGVNTITATDAWDVDGVLSGTALQIIDGKIVAAFGSWDGDETSTFRSKTSNEDVVIEGKWSHIAVGFHSFDDIRIFLNGEIVNGGYDGDATMLSYTDYGVGIIGNTQNFSTPFNGDIDEVNIFNRFLYSWEIDEMAKEPGMSASENEIVFHEVEAGGISVEQVFSVYGLNLLDDIVITAPEGFSISLTTTTGFTNELVVSKEDGLIDITPIFVRFEPANDNEYSGNIMISSEGLNDISISVVGNPKTTEAELIKNEDILIYPNPFSDNIIISNAKDTKRIVITNIIGQRVMDILPENDNIIQINTGSLIKGVYLITLINSNGIIKTEKLIKN